MTRKVIPRYLRAAAPVVKGREVGMRVGTDTVPEAVAGPVAMTEPVVVAPGTAGPAEVAPGAPGTAGKVPVSAGPSAVKEKAGIVRH